MSELYQLVLRMRESTLSRNRDFDTLSQPLARQARRIDKRLRGLERELRSSTHVEVRREPSGWRVNVLFPSVRMRREAYLTDEEHALLCRDPVLEAVLLPR